MVAKHRARVVVRVYIQKPGKDFQKVFASACDPDGDPAYISYQARRSAFAKWTTPINKMLLIEVSAAVEARIYGV